MCQCGSRMHAVKRQNIEFTAVYSGSHTCARTHVDVTSEPYMHSNDAPWESNENLVNSMPPTCMDKNKYCKHAEKHKHDPALQPFQLSRETTFWFF